MEKGALACIVSPNAVDAELAVTFLGHHGIAAQSYPGLRALAHVLDERTGCVIIVEEAMIAEEVHAMQEAIGLLPAWCDLPLVLVARDVGAFGPAVAEAFPRSGNVTLLERPLNPHTLASAVLVALRATSRQREVGELLAQRERAVVMRDEFLAMLAHELRNPLAPMVNAIYMMRKIKVDEPLLIKSTEILERQVNHVVRMVDDLMDVARMERGKVALQKKRVDLNRVVTSAVDTALPAAQQRGHHVNVRFGAGPLLVDGDPVRLEQIVCNLVNNAAKFSPQPGEIRVETNVKAGLAVISVQDQGIGFEPDAGEKLFDPFLQLNPTLARSAGGLGVGLTIVKRLTQLHGGSVHAASDGSGKGSHFEIRLPLAKGPCIDQGVPEDAPVNARPRRIVVVEDNQDIRETLQMLLNMWGHQVEMAVDGPSGVELVLRNRPEVALIDIGLPGMNGYDVARALRKILSRDAVRLIALTGYGQPTDREQALNAGFDSHLLKPITPHVLEQMLQRTEGA